MKFLRNFLAVGLSLMSGLFLQAKEQTEASFSSILSSNLNLLVTASDYCDFLNHVAKSDPDHLYDEKMSSDSKSSCIKRVGVPGKFHYEVIEGRENIPIAFVSKINERSYSDWKQNSLTENSELDHDSLKSNQNNFVVELAAEPILSLGRASTSSYNIDWNNALGIAGFIGLTAFGHELMIREGDELESAAEERALSQGGPLPAVLRSSVESDVLSIQSQVILSPEQAAITQLLRSAAIKNCSEMLARYEANETLWSACDKAWEMRTVAEQEARAKKELLAIATEVRNKKAAVELEKTILGRVSKYSGQAATVLGFVPCPIPLAGLATTISTASDLINQLWIQTDHAMADSKVAFYTHGKEIAEQNASKANQEVVSLEKSAKTAESLQRKAMALALRVDAEVFRPPATKLNKAAWHTWAEKIAQGAGIGEDQISKIAEYAMSDPSWARETAAIAWADRISFLEQNVKNLRDEKNPDEAVFKEAESNAKKARRAASARKARYDEGIKIHEAFKKELEEIHEDLNELEENAERAGVQREIEKKRNKFIKAWENVERAFADLKPLGEQAVLSNSEAVAEEEKFSPIRKEYEATKKTLLRNFERAKIQLVADRAAWNAVFLERKTTLPEIIASPLESENSSIVKGGENHVVSVEPPLTHDVDIEAEGKRLLKELRQEKLVPLQAAIRAIPKETLEVAEEKNNDHKKEGEIASEVTETVTSSEEDDFVIPEIREPTEADIVRWEAKKKVDQLKARIDEILLALTEKREEINEHENTEDRASVLTAESKSASDVSFLSKITGVGRGGKKDLRISGISEEDEDAWDLDSEMDDAEALAAKNAENAANTSKVSRGIRQAIINAASDLEVADAAFEKAMQAWLELAKEAEAKRISNGGGVVPEHVALEAWSKADEQGVVFMAKRQKIEKKEKAAARVEDNWAANTARWEAREIADACHEAVQEAEKETTNLIKNKYTTSIVSFEEREASRGKNEQAKAAAATALAVARAKALETEEAWSQLADKDRSIIITRAENEAAVTEAKKKLQEADRAVNARYHRLQQDRLNAMLEKNRAAIKGEAPQSQQSKLEEEPAHYKFELRTKKERDLARYFEEADKAKIAARKKYTTSRVPSVRAVAEALYSKVDELEEEGLKNYQAVAEHDALEAARNKTMGAEEAWEDRYQQAVKRAKAAREEAHIKNDMPSFDYWADDVQRKADRETGIAKADWRAFGAFVREAERLEDIETIWIADFEAEERLAKMKIENAAKNYFEGDTEEWEALSAAERSSYNQEVERANKEYTRQHTTTLKIAAARADEAFISAYKKRGFLFPSKGSKQEGIEASEKAKAEMIAVITKEAERVALIEWSKLPKSERREEKFKQLVTAHVKRLEQERWNALPTDLQIAELRLKTNKLKPLQAEYISKAAAARRIGEEEQAVDWDSAVRGMANATDYLGKAIESRATGKSEEAFMWEEAAVESQKQSEYALKAIEARAAGKTADTENFTNAGAGAFWASHRFAKAIEAKAARKLEEAAAWEKVVQESQRQVEFHLKAIEARAVGKKEDTESFTNAGHGASWASGHLAKAIEAREAGKLEEATAWERAAIYSQREVEFELKAIEANTAGKTIEVENFEYAAESYRNAASGMKQASDYRAKAIAAEAAEKEEESRDWKRAAEWGHLRSENNVKAAIEWERGMPEAKKRAVICDEAAFAIDYAADQLVFAIGAQMANRTEESREWKLLASNYETVYHSYLQAAEADHLRDHEKRDRLDQEGDDLMNEAERKHQVSLEVLLQKNQQQLKELTEVETTGKQQEAAAQEGACSNLKLAIDRLTKAMEARRAGNKRAARQLGYASGSYQTAYHHYLQAAEAYAGANQEEADRCVKQGEIYNGYGKKSDEKAEKIAKKEVRESSKEPFAKPIAVGAKETKNELTHEEQESSVNHTIATSLIESNRGFHKTAKPEEKISGEVDKVTQSNSKEAILLQIEQLNAEISDDQKKGDQAESADKKEASTYWYKARGSKHHATEELKGMIQAILSENREEEKNWRQAAEARLRAAEEYQKAAEAYEIGTVEKIEEAGELRLRALDYCKAALRSYRMIQIKRVTEMESLAHGEVVAIWKKALAANEQAEEQYSRSAIFNGGEERENQNSYLNAASAAEWTSKYFTRMGEAMVKGKSEEATAWEKASEESQRQLEFNLKAIEARAGGKTADVENFTSAGYGASWASGRLAEATEAKAAGKLEEATAWEKAVQESERQVEFHLKAIEARAAGKKADAESFTTAGHGASWASARLAKAIEAKAAGKLEEAAQWEKASEESERRVEFDLKAIEARAGGKTADAENFTSAGAGASWASDCLAKAIEAKKAGKLEDATQWEESARKSQKQSEYLLKAIEARAGGKTGDTESFTSAGHGACWTSDRLAKAIEAKAAGKLEEARVWEKASEESQRQVEFHLKAMKARAAGKTADAESFTNAGAGASWASNRLVKAIEAKAAGKLEEGTAWEKVSEESQQQVEFHLKAIEARAVGKTTDAENFTNAGNGASFASDRLAKAIEAKAAGKLEEAIAWEKTSEESRRRVEFYLKAIEARVAGKIVDAENFTYAGAGASFASDRLAKALEAKVAGKLEEATAWERAVTESQKQSEYFLKAIEARAGGKRADAANFTNAGISAFRASDRLVKAIEAKAVGKIEEAAQWEQAAILNQQACEDLAKAAEEYEKGNSWKFFGKGGNSWKRDAEAKMKQAKELAKTIEEKKDS